MNSCSFCGGDKRPLVVVEDEASICEFCTRNILAFFEHQREEMIENWDAEDSDFTIVPGGPDDDDNIH